jgi:hypothetical protein
MQKFGYEALVANRIDENLKNQMHKDGDLEFMWEGTDLGTVTPLLTHVLYDHYDFPLIFNPRTSYDFMNGNNDQVL